MPKILNIEIYKYAHGEYGVNLNINGKFAGARDISDISELSRVIDGVLVQFHENKIKPKKLSV